MCIILIILIFSPDLSYTVKQSSQIMIRSSKRFTNASSKVFRCVDCCLIKSYSSLMQAICSPLAVVSTLHFSRCSRSLKILSAISSQASLFLAFLRSSFLEFLQFLVDTIRGILLSTSDYLCNVLLELCMVGGLITKERVDSLNYHILQYCYFAFVVCKNLLSLHCIEFIKYQFWAYFLNSSECVPRR